MAASHILISRSASLPDADITRSKEEAKAEAERIRELTLKDGNDFAVMAREHLTAPRVLKVDLGKFKFEVMAKTSSKPLLPWKLVRFLKLWKLILVFMSSNEPNKDPISFLSKSFSIL